MIVVVYLSFVSIDIIDVNKLVAGGVSGRDPADDDDDYRIQSKLRDTLV